MDRDIAFEMAKVALEKVEGTTRIFTENQLKFIHGQKLDQKRVYRFAHKYGSAGLGIIRAMEEKV